MIHMLNFMGILMVDIDGVSLYNEGNENAPIGANSYNHRHHLLPTMRISSAVIGLSSVIDNLP